MPYEPTLSPAAGLSPRCQRATLIVVCLATAMLMLDIAVVNTALPLIGRDLHTGLSGLQWVIDAYTLVLAAIVLSAGSVADRRGRRRVFATGTAIFTATSLACGLANSGGLLIAARAVQGLGAAFMFASSLAILADAFPEPRERAGAMAAYGAALGSSFAVGPALGGALTTWLGWRAVFFINVPLGLLALIGITAWVRESGNPAARSLDWPGQIALSGGLFLLVLALLRGNLDGWASASTLVEIALAGALLVGFVAIEARQPVAMLPLKFFARRDFTAAQVAALTISAGFFAIYLYLTLYLQDVLHYSPLSAGVATLPGTIVLFVVSGASAPLAQRVAPGKLVGTSLILVAAGVALMSIVGAHSSWLALQPGFLLACFATGIVNPSLGMLALGAGRIDDSGLLAGANEAFRSSGVAIGVAAFGALIPSGAALGHGSPAAYVTGLHHALYLGATIIAVGAGAVLALVRTRPAAHSQLITTDARQLTANTVKVA